MVSQHSGQPAIEVHGSNDRSISERADIARAIEWAIKESRQSESHERQFQKCAITHYGFHNEIAITLASFRVKQS